MATLASQEGEGATREEEDQAQEVFSSSGCRASQRPAPLILAGPDSVGFFTTRRAWKRYRRQSFSGDTQLAEMESVRLPARSAPTMRRARAGRRTKLPSASQRRRREARALWESPDRRARERMQRLP